MKTNLNDVKNRILPIQESALKGLEDEIKITDFEILKSLGRNTFLVRHKDKKTEFFLKAIDKNDINHNQIDEYFNKKLEILYKINHPNIVKLFTNFEDNNYCYFLLEYSPKGNLYLIFPEDKKKRIGKKFCASMIKDVISGIYYLHNMNPPFIYKNISCENIIVFNNLTLKLSNLIFLKNENMRKNLIISKNNIYLSPEYLKEKKFDKSFDIWGIGILLFELVTGYLPFTENNYDDLLNENNELNIKWTKDIYPDAKDLIAKILKINPEERLSLEEMIKHPFINQFFPESDKILIKPEENIKYKPFVISKDDPVIWKHEKNL